MNDDMPHIDTDAAEREWQAQERARLRGAGAGLAGDRDAQRYRLIADALRTPLPVQLPPDFAETTARRAGRADPARLERNLMRVLVAIFGLAAALAAARYGAQWWQLTLQGPLRVWLLNPWLPALLACLGVSAIAGVWQPSPYRLGSNRAGPA